MVHASPLLVATEAASHRCSKCCRSSWNLQAVKLMCLATLSLATCRKFDSFNGGQRLNKALTQALSTHPNVLLLDEPTNHLDKNNRKSFMRMICASCETLITVSHDVEFLRTCIDTLWHIDNGQIHVFSGNYDDYINEKNLKRTSITQKLARIDR